VLYVSAHSLRLGGDLGVKRCEASGCIGCNPPSVLSNFLDSSHINPNYFIPIHYTSIPLGIDVSSVFWRFFKKTVNANVTPIIVATMAIIVVDISFVPMAGLGG